MHDFAIQVLTAQTGKTHLFAAGQAGFILKSKSGQLLGIDLFLSECVERIEGHPGFKRLLPKILDPFELQFDYLIATHPHLDHFDLDAVPALMSNGKTRLFASTDCGELVSRLHMTDRSSQSRITYVKPGDTCTAGDFTLHFVNCDHGQGAPDAVGVVAEVDGRIIYEAGDTCLRLDRTEEYRTWGTPDVLIAPINGAFGNLNEEECTKLAEALQPGLTVPCHYGMFASHGGDVGKFYDIMNRKGLPQFLRPFGGQYTL